MRVRPLCGWGMECLVSVRLDSSDESPGTQPPGRIEPQFHGTHQRKSRARFSPAICKVADGEGGCFDCQGQRPARCTNGVGHFLIRPGCASEESQTQRRIPDKSAAGEKSAKR